MKIFEENVYFVEKLNNENGSAKFEINKFSDWTEEEFGLVSCKQFFNKNFQFIYIIIIIIAITIIII